MADENDVSIRFGANVEGLEEGSERGKEAIEGLKEHLDALKESSEQVHEIFETMLEAAGIEVGLDAIKEFIEKNAELGEDLERTAAKLGITGSEASGLMGVAKLTGTSFDGLQTAMERLQVGLATVDTKSSRTAEALRVLGVSAKEMASSSITQQINILAEAISKFQDGATKTAAVQALGRSFVELLPLLDKGKEGLEELNTTLDATGAKMSNEMVAAFAHTAEDLNTMKAAWQGFSNTIFSAVNPAIDAAVKGLTNLIEHADPMAIQRGVAGLTGSLVTMGADIAKFAVEARVEWEKLLAVIGAIGGPLASTGEKMADVLNGIVASTKASPEWTYEMQTGYANLFAKLGLISKEFADKWKQDQAAIYTSAKGTFGGIDEAATRTNLMLQSIDASAKEVRDSLAKIGMPTSARSDAALGGEAYNGPAATKRSVPQMQLGGGGKEDHTAQQDARADAEYDLEQWKANAQEKTDLLNKELAEHQITMTQWLAQSKDALGDEAQDVIATYQAELQTAGLTYAQIVNLKKQEAAALKEIAHQVSGDEDKAAKEAIASWKSGADQIASVMNSQVDGLLRGTETFSQAFQNMFVSAIEDIIKELIKLAVEMAFIKTIMPAVGGGSGGPLGTLFHAIGIPGFAEGTDYVPQTGVALVHQGERIIPANQNNGGGSGDTHIHFSPQVNAVDARGVQAMLNDYAPQFAKTVANHWTANQNSRPKY